MSETEAQAYIFWIYPSDSWMFIWKSFSDTKILKCVINAENLQATNLSGATIFELPLKSITNCAVKHSYRSPLSYVYIEASNSLEIILIPVNPFDPPVFFNKQDAEAQAMVEIINCLRKSNRPAQNPNPYLRQLAKGDVPKYAENLQTKWEADVSPWDYYHSNMMKVDGKRRFAVNLFRIYLIAALLMIVAIWIYIALHLLSK